MGILLAIIIFSFIVIFHELGHFLLAKKNGIDVDEFSLGMGPVLWSKEHKGTTYCLKLLPIGGSCMMGEDEEATDSPGNFNNKSVWARMAVIAGGPVFNFILAFLFAAVITLMVGYDKPVIQEVEEDYPACEAGLLAGDTVVRMNGQKINLYREISMYNQFHQGEEVTVVYRRDGVEHTVTVKPKMDEELGYYRLGIRGGAYEKADIFRAVQYGAYEVRYWIRVTLDSLRMLVTRQIGLDQLSGPVGIVDVVDDTYQQSKSYGVYVVVVELLNIAILLSANLGVMNLLPLPALDGGRLVFLVIEAIRGKRVPPEKEGYVHFIGIVFLMALMVFVLFQDIRRIFF